MGSPRGERRDTPESESGCVCVAGSPPVSGVLGWGSRIREGSRQGADSEGLVPTEGEPGGGEIPWAPQE